MVFKKAVKEIEPPRHKPCAYAGCPHEAIVNWKTANVCRQHYDMLTLAEAKEYTASLGLKTRADLMRFCAERKGQIGRGKMHGVFLAEYLRRHPQPEREPGQDDEELAA